MAILGSAGIAANANLFLKNGRKKRNLTPEQKIAARDKWRPVFKDYFQKPARENYKGDAIIHDVDRLDTYPDTGDEKGISSWFRLGLMGTYHRGVLLGLQWTNLEEHDGEWVENPASKRGDAIKVMLLGEVPYESIESVNFDGDDFYDKPHIFRHFDHSGEPY